jgi:hypothetical protein
MRMVISVDSKSVDKLVDEFRDFQNYGVHGAVEVGSKKLLAHLKTNVAQGKSATGAAYPDVEDITMERPIAHGGPFKDTRIRGDVSGNRTAINVTGQSIEAPYISRTGPVTEIRVDDPRSILVFKGNASPAGPVKKPKRDPLGLTLQNATDLEFDLIADAVENAIDRIVSGL